ncbi:Phosphoribosylaminoimidazole-succinocarboxamide synthase [Diplonema papillatum]|nr:Phosphoribosylaminoimidazole-succinocarboxamide synthase [Diplonema papillatum]KAJ9463008.1 Phosphoribosylaminoimidazole-succinocarboxamide synthase [Diplonema papillatum]
MSADKILKAECLDASFMPELGPSKKGKVRDIYFSEDKVLMVATDRVSAFDHNIPNLIPYKGMLLNKIATAAFKATEDIVANAVIGSPDPNVVIQKKVKNLGVECIVRGYMWGSMAGLYEKGGRDICGLTMPDGLLRYQQLPEPIFTPTTKAETGPDENMTFAEVEELVGKDLAAQVRELSMKLYQRGCEVAAKAEPPLLFIDTKYEFGLDADNKLYLIDEVNTPDSSRLCSVAEYNEKWPKIAASAKDFKNVTELLNQKPELKVKEFSKQYVRDVLLEAGFKPGKEVPKLTEEQVVECTKRYIQVYESLTHEKFDYPLYSVSASTRLVNNLKHAGVIKGFCAIIAAGSNSDLGHMEKLSAALDTWGIPSKKRICSAHKQPSKLENLITTLNTSIEPVVIIGCAGGTDALSGTASFSSVFPVISCPPDGRNETCLTNPPGSSNSYILRPDNVAKHVAQLFSIHSPVLAQKLVAAAKSKVAVLEKVDCDLW